MNIGCNWIESISIGVVEMLKISIEESLKMGWIAPDNIHWPSREEIDKATDKQKLEWFKFLPKISTEEQADVFIHLVMSMQDNKEKGYGVSLKDILNLKS
jgi:hypothetical protein